MSVAKVYEPPSGAPLSGAGPGSPAEIEELRQRLAARASELDFANHELELFAASISQDLQAPLRAIHGFAKALRQKQGPYLDADAKHYLDRIEANAAFMGRLIGEMNRFTRVTHADLNVERVNPTDIAVSALAHLQARASEYGVEVEIGTLPDCDADAALLEQVFLSLLDNSIKFSRGRPHAKVKVGAARVNGEDVYSVIDNGVGFDMRYAGKLFSVFQRLHPQADFEGVGVGLALVQRIVHRHGGRVWAEGEPNRGASFHFTLANAGG